MSEPHAVYFPLYRRYEEMRVATNDAAIGLLIAARMTAERLSATKDSGRLPQLFTIEGIDRMNVRPAQMVTLLGRAERHHAYMAIPYALATYESFVKQLILMTLTPGTTSEESRRAISEAPLSKLHELLAQHTNLRPDPVHVELFEFSRMLRNRIVHYSATCGSNLRSQWSSTTSSTARTLWCSWTGRVPSFVKASEQLPLGVHEVIAVLATCKRLSQEISAGMASALTRDQWADIVVEDLRQTAPNRWGQPATRQRRVVGQAREFYRAIGLTPVELRAAIERI